MRLSIVATSGALSDLRPGPGSLDGDVVRSRLPLPDTAFRVEDLDPSSDVAEQIEMLFEREGIDLDAPTLFYVSCSALLSAEGELFLTLDPTHPETGDSLADIAMVFRERTRGPIAFLLELRHAPDPDDPFRSASFVAAAKSAVAPSSSGIELLVTARPYEGGVEDRPSPITRALIEALDHPSAEAGLTISRFFEEARELEAVVEAVPCLTHAGGTVPFEIVPRPKRSLAPPSRSPKSQAPEPPQPAEEPPPPRSEDAQEATVEMDASEVPTAPLDIVRAPELPRIPPPAPAPPEALPIIEDAPSVDVILDEDSSDRVAILRAEAPVAPPPPVRAKPPSAPPPRAAPSAPPPAPHRPSAVPPAATTVITLAEEKPSREPEARIIISPRASEPPPAARASEPPPAARASEPPRAAEPATAATFMAKGDALFEQGDAEGALTEYKRALGMLGAQARAERADLSARIGLVKQRQGKRREAIASFEKALSFAPSHAVALRELVDLNLAEGDTKAVHAAEERLLATLGEEARRERILDYAARWEQAEGGASRARALYERAREMRPDDLTVLDKLVELYRAASLIEEALATERRAAELTADPRRRAERYAALARVCLNDLKREEAALALLDLALESDPSMLEPLAVIARVLAERQEWSELERAYRKMLERTERIAVPEVRADVTWELCRRLGLLFRDHLEDPALALDAFEDAVSERPNDLSGRIIAADLARSLGKHDRAAAHLVAAARLDPSRVATFHDLFEAFQKLRLPDRAYAASCVTMFLRQADARERFIFEEHKPAGVPKLKRALARDAWDAIRVAGRDHLVEAVLDAIAPAAIAVKLADLAAEGRLPALDPSAKQDPEVSTISIVRSFTWASHFLGVPSPAIYVHEDADVGLAAVMSEDPVALAGGRVLRGRSLPELSFLAGRHLAYYVGAHRLLLYFPSIEELSACFLAAVTIALPSFPLPAAAKRSADALAKPIAARLSAEGRADVVRAVKAFESSGKPADLGAWVGAVERAATRAGFLLMGDVEVAAKLLRTEPRTVLDAEEKIADLLSFSVSDEIYALRTVLGLAIEP